MRVIVVMGACIVLMVAIGLFGVYGIANAIAEGELGNDVVIDSRGEFGSLLSALKKMDQQLTTSVRGIKRSTESVTVASREIASGNMDLSAHGATGSLAGADDGQYDGAHRDGQTDEKSRGQSDARYRLS